METTERNDLPSLKDAPALEIAKEMVRILDSKKAGDIRLLHVEEKTILTEYFIICTGNSTTQVRALIGEVEYQMGLREVKPCAEEGFDGASWIVADYGPVILHVFNEETRMFYNLEKLWSDSAEVDLSGILTED